MVTPVSAQHNTALKPPVAAREPHETAIHGYKLSDDYFWLRRKTDPAVRAYLEAENAYTAAVMKPTEALQQALYDEIVAHVKQTDLSVPYRRGAYMYYSRTETGKQYPAYLRKPVGGGREEVLLDQNELAKGKGYYAIGARVVSDDDSLLAFTFDSTGYRQYVLRIKNLRTGQMLPDRIDRVGSVVWSADGRTLFVTTEDSVTKRSDKFWRHPVGTATMSLMFDEKDELFDVFAYRSLNKEMIFLQSAAKTSSEMHYLPSARPGAALTVLIPRAAGHEYDADYDGGRFYMRTNKGARNFRVVSAPMAAPSDWTEVVAGNPNVKIANTEYFRDHMVLSEREGGLPYIRIIDKKTGASHRIAAAEPAFSMGTSSNQHYDTGVLQYSYNSMVTPPSTFEYDMAAKTRELIKQQEVPGYESNGYESSRVWVTTRDGTKVPVALVYRKGTKMDGSAPMLLYAYGSYGFSQDPGFSSARLALLDRGFIYALASIRGGGELGEDWREGGRMMNKMNTFNDFIDVAQHLVDRKYTASDRLMIQGGSAGGLLMGAVVNMRPELFKAVIAQVPFVDVINTMLDASLPLTTSEYTEWGNPNEKPAFDYMMSYSPYDNITSKRYPNMLVEVSLNDSQVPYWEGAKFVAKLRSMKKDDTLLLLKTHMGAGHGGASGRYDRFREIAFSYAFLVSQMPKK
ncbi:MAG: S9 family peptidase [Gemmatimonadaceae bacterium]|nr:S9 family peptidase [Gemmatimonadaceae bacterium]